MDFRVVKPNFPVGDIISVTREIEEEIIPIYQTLYLITITSNMIPSYFSSIKSSTACYGLFSRIFTNVENRKIDDIMIKILDDFLYLKVISNYKVKSIDFVINKKEIKVVYDKLNPEVICVKLSNSDVYKFLEDDTICYLTITWQ